MNKLLIYAATMLAVTGCVVVDDSALQEEIENKVTVIVNTGTATKVDFASDNNNGLAISWVEGESLGGWESGASSFSEFTMDLDSYALESAAFTGVSSRDFRLVHPYQAATNINDNSFEIDLSTQTVDMSGDGLNHISSTTYMLSAISSVETANSLSVYMKHLGLVVALNLYFSNLPAENLKIASIALSGNGFDIPVVGSANFAFDADQSGSLTTIASGTINATIENSPMLVDGQMHTINISSLPFTRTDGNSIEIKVVLESEDGTKYIKRFNTQSNAGDLSFARASYSSISYNCDMSDVAPMALGSIYYEDNLACGIVYQIASDNSYAMVFSMDQIESILSDMSIDVYSNGLSTDSYDGFSNTANVVAVDGYSSVTFPAFYWCVEHGEGWYLASRYELQDLLTAVWGDGLSEYGFDSAISSSITAVGADAFSVGSATFFSSTFSGTSKNRTYIIKYSAETNMVIGVSAVNNSSISESLYSIRAVKKVSL